MIGLLRAFDRLMVQGEIFSAKKAYGLEWAHEGLSRLAAVPSADVADPAFTGWLRQHPGEVLDYLVEQAGSRCLTVKLLPRHLATDLVSALLSRADVAVVFLTRRPIDCYISEEKARAIQQWKAVDTTGIAIDGDAERFVAWFTRYRDWYRRCRAAAAANGRLTADLHYEADIALSDADALERLRQTLHSLGVDAGHSDMARATAIPKQDAGSDYTAKVRNWASFQAELLKTPHGEAAFSEAAFQY
jgi:hypothetical protein